VKDIWLCRQLTKLEIFNELRCAYQDFMRCISKVFHMCMLLGEFLTAGIIDVEGRTILDILDIFLSFS
jgi:hypothetical protein